MLTGGRISLFQITATVLNTEWKQVLLTSKQFLLLTPQIGNCSAETPLTYGGRLSPDDAVLCPLFPVQHFFVYQLCNRGHTV